MAKQKFDSVIEAVRLDENGQLLLARIYDNRGPIFSDHILIKREELIERLKSGKQILTGKRTQYTGSRFETGAPLKLISQNGEEHLSVNGESQQDNLNGLPRF